MNFINLPSRSRRLVPVPSVIIRGDPVLVGFDSNLQATIASVPFAKEVFSLVLVLPGKPADYIAGGLSQIEYKLNNETWNNLITKLQSVPGVGIQIPTLDHR